MEVRDVQNGKLRGALKFPQMDLVRASLEKTYSQSHFSQFVICLAFFLLGWLILPLGLIFVLVQKKLFPESSSKPSRDRSNMIECSFLGVYCLIPVFLLCVYFHHYDDEESYKSGFYTVIFTVFVFPVAMSFSFSVQNVLSRKQSHREAAHGSIAKKLVESAIPPVLSLSVTSKAETLEAEACPLKPQSLGAFGTACLYLLEDSVEFSSVPEGSPPEDSAATYSGEFSIGAEGVTLFKVVDHPGPCLYIWGDSGRNCCVANAGEEVALELLEGEDTVLILAPYAPTGQQSYACCFEVSITRGQSVGNKISKSIALLFGSFFALTFAYSHSLIPHIYQWTQDGTWPCVYPRVCGIPCAASPLEVNYCWLPVGEEATLVPAYYNFSDTNASGSISGSWAPGLQGGWFEQGLKHIGNAAYGPCNVGIHSNHIDWFTSDPIPFARLHDAEGECRKLVKDNKIKCKGPGLKVRKPFADEDGSTGKKDDNSHFVKAYLVETDAKEELLAWEQAGEKNSMCAQDEKAFDGLCVWSRNQNALRTPSFEDYNDPLQLGPFSVSCSKKWIQTSDGLCMIGMEMSTLLYMMVVIACAMIPAGLYASASTFDELNELPTVFQLRTGTPEERQAQLTHRLMKVRKALPGPISDWPELEMAVFPVLPQEVSPPVSSAQDGQTATDAVAPEPIPASNPAIDVSWWLGTKTAATMQLLSEFEPQKPVLAFMTVTSLTVIGTTIGQSATEHELQFPLALYALWDGLYFGMCLLCTVVAGARINRRIDAGLAGIQELGGGDSDQTLASSYQEQHPYRLTLFGIPFNTALLVSYASTLGGFGVSLMLAFGKDYIAPFMKDLA